MADIAKAEIRRLTGAVEEAVTYPFLTKESGGYASRGADSGAAPGTSLTKTAQGAIRDLLGWRYRADDAKGSSPLSIRRGVERGRRPHRTDVEARTFTVQADLGEVTGAQASIYERARLAVEHAVPLLDSLTALRPDADDESTESVRSMVRSSLTELVAELGTVGGPANPTGQRVLHAAPRRIRIRSAISSARKPSRTLVGRPEKRQGRTR